MAAAVFVNSLWWLGYSGSIKMAVVESEVSGQVSAPLVSALCKQDPYPCAILEEQAQLKAKAQQGKLLAKLSRHAADVIKKQPSSVQCAVEIVSEKGASSWLSALPIETHKFDLSKASFHDAVCLRYGWAVPHLPSTCICGSLFTVSHALQCSMGRWISSNSPQRGSGFAGWDNV